MLRAGTRRLLMSGSLRAFGVVVGVLTALLAGLIVWASLEKNVLEIFKVMWAERWGIVTLLDLYLGFLIAGAWIVALGGVVLGVVLSFEADWPPGPSIVLVLTAAFALAAIARRAGLARRPARQ
jgi:uncharacterized BrkB/YihY/UPF0761 family membrane protein